MKRLLLLLVMIFTVCLFWATIDEYYSFNATTGTYTPITGTNAGISSDNAISAAIPIGFSFLYGDYTFTDVKISTNGWVGLGTSQTGSNQSNVLSSTTRQPVVAPLWDDLSMASGTVSYLTSGTAPNRIFTVQYENAKWNYAGPVGFNFQVSLYETGKVSFIYGASGGTATSPSASIGINMTPGGAGWFYSVTPTSGTASITTELNTISAFPAQGTVYEFNPVVAQPNDLAASAISVNTIPSVGLATIYTITVRNRGTNPQSTYQVKLIDSNNNELASVAGTAIQPNQILTFQISWTPTVAGPMVIRGKVVLAGDQNPNNDLTPTLSITVQPAGVQAVTIADGTETFRVPMDFYWKNSLCEVLYLSDELGFASGTITALAFYTNFTDSPANGATKIWLGSTNIQDLTGGWIPSTQLNLVFIGNITYPSGVNMITVPLQTPYMHTSGNLVMLVQRPMDTQFYSPSDYFYGLTIGTSRSLNVYRDSPPYDSANPPAGTTPTGQVPKTSILYTNQLITNDIGCLSITGNTTPSVGAVSNYTVTIKNYGTATQTNYMVKLMQEGGIEVASVQGPAINSLQTLPVTVPWTPTQTGATYIYGEVVLADDEYATNNQTAQLNVEVMPAGLTVIQIGQGTAVNSTTGSPTPYGTSYKNFRQQYLYLASDIYAAGGTPGLINALAFYVSSVNNCSAMPNYTIKIKHTDQTELTTTFEVGEYTTVWNNANFLPTTGWNVHTFTTPFFWNGASNLLIDICTDLIPGDWTQNASVTYTPTNVNTCLRYQSDTIPASSATTGYNSVNRANTRLFMTIFDMGSLTGVVSSGENLLSNATVSIVGTVFQTVTTGDGSYYFQYVPVGTQQVMATKHGYNEVTHTVTIVEDQTITQNFELSPLPQVSVSGRIVGSDNPTVGLANAIIALTGYEPYSAVTNASGIFTIPNVYTNHTYNYTVTVAGYQTATGQVVVGSTNVNMGDILVTEHTFSPILVHATDNGAMATITWYAPLTAKVRGEIVFSSNPETGIVSSSLSKEELGVNSKTLSRSSLASQVSLSPFTNKPNGIDDRDRIPLGYQVWRMLQGQENNESAWTLLTTEPINALLYADTAWPTLPDGVYKWAVKTVYTNGVYSVASLSNALVMFHEIGTIAGIVCNMHNQPIQDATITCENVTATTNAAGAYSLSILVGTHNVTASHPNYQSVTQQNIVVVTGQTTTVNFQLPPLSLPYSDGFESYPDFALTFAPWTLVDVDQSSTYGIQDYTWEHIYNPQAFIIFNPSATTPPLTSLTAHTGNKMACCFAATTPPNNDWLISPQFTGANTIRFWARSYTSEFGLERFKVGIASNTNPNSFVFINGPGYITAPAEWTEYTYHTAQPGALYFGIQCVSNDAFIFCVDDVTISTEDIDNPEIPVAVTALGNNYPNPFNPETTIAYSVKETGPVTIEVYNLKGQLVKTLIKGRQEPGNHTIVWDGKDNNGHSVSSGVYYYKMQAGTYSSTKKMIMMK